MEAGWKGRKCNRICCSKSLKVKCSCSKFHLFWIQKVSLPSSFPPLRILHQSCEATRKRGVSAVGAKWVPYEWGHSRRSRIYRNIVGLLRCTDFSGTHKKTSVVWTDIEITWPFDYFVWLAAFSNSCKCILILFVPLVFFALNALNII